MARESVRIEVLAFEGCPHAEAATQLAQAVAVRLGPGITVARVEVDTPERAAEVRFLGSPSIRVNGLDVERTKTFTGALCCRTYDGGLGIPPEWLVEAAVLRAPSPRGILFLCVANSARSQMAEGLARFLAPPGMKIWSAGSRPTHVRPEAVTGLARSGLLDSLSLRHTCSEQLPQERPRRHDGGSLTRASRRWRRRWSADPGRL
jgi:hypothetical protein